MKKGLGGAAAAAIGHRNHEFESVYGGLVEMVWTGGGEVERRRRRRRNDPRLVQ